MSYKVLHNEIENLNDSIQTYVWTILSAQAQTRTNILGIGKHIWCPEAVSGQCGRRYSSLWGHPHINRMISKGSAVCQFEGGLCIWLWSIYGSERHEVAYTCTPHQRLIQWDCDCNRDMLLPSNTYVNVALPQPSIPAHPISAHHEPPFAQHELH